MLLPDPFETLSRLQQALDAFQQSDWLESSPSGTGPYPPVNVFRKGDDFVIAGRSTVGARRRRAKVRPRWFQHRRSLPGRPVVQCRSSPSCVYSSRYQAAATGPSLESGCGGTRPG
jgi:hypothetical protein